MKSGAAFFFAKRVLGLGDRGEGAARYIRGAVAGVALSLVPLVVVMVVADSMIEGITARYIEVGTYHLQVKPFYAVEPDELAKEAALLRKAPGVRGAYVELQSPAVAILGSRTAGVDLRSVEDAYLEDPKVAEYLRVTAGKADLSSSNRILLGEALAKNLGAKVGDIVTIATTKAVAAPGGVSGGAEVALGKAAGRYAPKVSAFKVSGIVSAGYRELDSLWAFVSLKAGARLSAPGVTYPMIGIKILSPYGDLEPARESLRKAISAAGDDEDWSVVTWPEAERNVFKSFSTTKALLMLVMAVAVAVAAINVSSALVMLVLERRRDIAILKSCGASPGFIRRIFVLAGLGVGASGTAIGIGAGALVSWRINDLIAGAEALANWAVSLAASLAGARAPHEAIKILDPAYYLERIPVSISLGELGIVALCSLVLCFLASLVPARRASRLPPLEIFRKT